ncbi:MAG TPA: Rieske 2Fe-2S domain-containing protein [Candidatus Nanopelagicales bacterium]|nr:Rieske 2Fe-2S domain-containing protein [Candidatus Nanopelagicales bacterium]
MAKTPLRTRDRGGVGALHLDVVRDDERAGSEGVPGQSSPSGWYVLAHARELPRGAVLTRRLASRDVVLFRGESGRCAALDAMCPHMGAHLGHGGRVEGETLRCPFHGFRFDRDGVCVATGYGTRPPPGCRAGRFAVHETHGLVLVWYGATGEAPFFEVPSIDLDGWTPFRWKRWSMRGHPQETSENSVDFGHLAVVHGYRALKVVRELTLDGPYLNVVYGMERPLIPGLLGVPIRAEFEIHVHGLGYSFVEVRVLDVGLRTRHFVLSTPTDPERVCFEVGLSLERLRAPRSLRSLPEALRRLPGEALSRVVAEAAFQGFVHDVMQDFTIWRHKRYVQAPALAEGDGPIGRYRRWARQFYAGEAGARGGVGAVAHESRRQES